MVQKVQVFKDSFAPDKTFLATVAQVGQIGNLIERTDYRSTLAECFLLLVHPDVPRFLVAEHAALVKSTSEFENSEKSYQHGTDLFTFRCYKEKNWSFKDRANIKIFKRANMPPGGMVPTRLSTFHTRCSILISPGS